MLEVRNVVPNPMKNESFADESVWQTESVVFEKGQNHIVKAHSGKGKSTLIAYLYGLRSDYSGSVTYKGKDIKELSLMEKAEIRKSSLSILLQDMRLFPKLTVMDNLRLKNQLTNHKTDEEIVTMLDKFGLAHKTEQICGTLSLGQQQRVAMIRALLQPFDLLLMDEPFSHLDIVNQEIGCKMIQDECDQNNGGVILASLGEDYFLNYDKRISV